MEKQDDGGEIMSQAQKGDRVTVEYTGRLENGQVFATSKGRAPMKFKIGNGEVIPGFEEGIIGMRTGETKSITIPPEKAYGPKKKELIVEAENDGFFGQTPPKEGDRFEIRRNDGALMKATVVKVDRETVLLDGNHPLAGEPLAFDVRLLEVQ